MNYKEVKNLELSCIYKLTSPSGKIYIGQTINSKYRFKEYLRSPLKYKTKIYIAIRKYGFENFDIEFIEIIEESNKIILKSILNKLEPEYIHKFNCIEFGYNLTSGGDGFIHSEESKIKMKLSAMGRVVSDETKIKLHNAHLGAKHTIETIKKIQYASSNMSEESKNKMKLAYKNQPEDIKLKISRLGYNHTIKSKLKISESQFIGVTQFDKQNNFIKKYDSLLSASIENNIDRSCISKCINNKLKSAGGFIWIKNKNDNKN